MIALVVVGDGREDYLSQAMTSAAGSLSGPISERWLFDDSGDDDYRAGLADAYPAFAVLGEGVRRGFAGAVGWAWQQLRVRSACRFVFWLEEDFVFNQPVDLASLAEVLHTRRHLAQLALRRQPWNAQEAKAGGVIEQDPESYDDVVDGVGHRWLEHRKFFTTNPSLFRRELLELPWPAGAESEGRFGLRLFERGFGNVASGRVRCGFWGGRQDPPIVNHIGFRREGSGY